MNFTVGLRGRILALDLQQVARFQRPVGQKRIGLPEGRYRRSVFARDRVECLARLYPVLHGASRISRVAALARSAPRAPDDVAAKERPRKFPPTRCPCTSSQPRAARHVIARDVVPALQIRSRSRQSGPLCLPACRLAARGNAPFAPPAGTVGTFNRKSGGTVACGSQMVGHLQRRHRQAIVPGDV